MKRLLVAGTRTITPSFSALDHAAAIFFRDKVWITVVHGDAQGVDRTGAAWAKARRYKQESHPADWAKWGKRAGPIRNQEMLESGIDAAIFFWDGKSPGTRDMINRVAQTPTPYIVIVGAA
jgi:hypothetical protein